MISWKTTFIGFAAAALNLIQNGVAWKSAFMSAAIASLGIMAKDFDRQ